MSERNEELEDWLDTVEDVFVMTFSKICMVGFVSGALIGLLAAVMVAVMTGRW